MSKAVSESSIRWPCPAKVNLFLHITGRRDDGYHELQTVFQFLDRADHLQFDGRADHKITLSPNVPGVPAESNLIVRAARLLQQTLGIRRGVDIKLDKILPTGAGLGGGSSNAATTLLALNALWSCGLSIDELAELGVSLGADVPVFVRGHACWAEGIGEIISPVSLPSLWFVVLIPGVHTDTSTLFSSPHLTRDCSPITIRDFFAGTGSNVFQHVAVSTTREVKAAVDCLNNALPKIGEKTADQQRVVSENNSVSAVVCDDHSAVWQNCDGLVARLTSRASLTGTGSCVFIATRDQPSAQHLLAEALRQGATGDAAPGPTQQLTGFVARGLSVSPLHQMIQDHVT